MTDNKKIYLTKEGLEELKKEYEGLTHTRRPELIERVAQARNMGDLSENGEYMAARDELSFIDGRIEEIEEILRQATVISEKVQNGSKKVVQLGSTVVLKREGKKESFTLVGEWEADPMEKKISHESPLGKALIGKERGEKVEVEAPAGHINYTIVEVK